MPVRLKADPNFRELEPGEVCEKEATRNHPGSPESNQHEVTVKALLATHATEREAR